MDFLEYRSEEVQEILGTPPSWLIRWGTAVVFFLFVCLIGLAWFLKYPDVLTAEALITTTTPPVDVVTRTEGRILQTMVQDRQTVQQGDILAVMQNPASYEDVLNLGMSVQAWQNSSLDSLKTIQPVQNLTLGEIQDEYADFLQQLDFFKLGKYSGSASFQSNVGAIQAQISQLEQSIQFDQKGLKRTADQLKSAEEYYQKQKKLYEEGITSQLDFERERTKLADIERQRDIYEENILRKRNEIIALKSSINTASFGQQSTSSSATSRLQASLSTLRSSIEQWKQNYLLVAPVSGKVSYSNVNEQQFVQQGKALMSIVPPSSGQIVAQISLPMAGSGKVDDGQKVLIKLDGYPYQEFGAVQGKIESKSLVPQNGRYLIIATLAVDNQNQLVTLTGKKVEFQQKLSGVAEIITNEKGFLERILERNFNTFN